MLDGFHLAMRLTVMGQMAKGLGLGGRGNLASEAARQLQRVKWFLWHGNLFRAYDPTRTEAYARRLSDADTELSSLRGTLARLRARARAIRSA